MIKISTILHFVLPSNAPPSSITCGAGVGCGVGATGVATGAVATGATVTSGACPSILFFY